MKEAAAALLAYLVDFSERADLRHVKIGAYVCTHDFIAQHGKAYTPQELPKKYMRGMPKGCFGNALALALAYPELRYVEGYALLADGPQFPIHHGWAVDPDGLVIDNTWRTAGAAYRGVEFALERVFRDHHDRDSCVIDDWKNNWPLLQEQWQGEVKWPANPMLEEMRRLLQRKIKQGATK